MSDIPRKPELAEARNGVVTPLYFDRQIIRAEDLTLDRASHDHELARMRRILHGWGVVAGLIPKIHDDSLTLSGGYGITRTGAEIYLTEALTVTNIASRVWGCCGPGDVTCEAISLEERRNGDARLETGTVTAWLVARPTQATGSLRSGIAEECAHPANDLSPSRVYAGLSIGLLCELPPGFIPAKRDCKKLPPFFCDDPVAMLPMPPEPTAQDNLLVLGRIVAGPESAMFTPQDRRSVLPLSLLQDWLQSCRCQAQTDPDQPSDTPEPGDADSVIWDREPDLKLSDAADRLVGNGFRRRRLPPEKPDTRPAVPELLTDPRIHEQLDRAGITTVGELFAIDNAKLAQTLGVTASEAQALMAEVKPLGVFVTRGGY
uniref:hypothetical protein n=1 Tax=uncultured Halomonas sp. TaxID=173971 RepID=UPI002607A4DC|nr:hypothetical protein [uncultured Halomonas sp.]